MYSLIYTIVVMVIAFLKLNDTNIYSFYTQFVDFNDQHVVTSIVIPVLQMIYQVVSSFFLQIISYNISFANIMDKVYSNITETQRTWYSVILYSFELFVYFSVIACYVLLFSYILKIVSNVNSENEIINEENKKTIFVICGLLAFLIVHAVLSTRVNRKYDQKQQELAKKMITFINLLLYVLVVLIALRFVMTRQSGEKVIEEGVTSNPLVNIVKNHVMLTIVLQVLFTIFHTIKVGTSNENYHTSIKKEHVFASIVYALSLLV